MPGVTKNWGAAREMTLAFIQANGKTGVARSASAKAEAKSKQAAAKEARQAKHKAYTMRQAARRAAESQSWQNQQCWNIPPPPPAFYPSWGWQLPFSGAGV